MTDLRRVVTTTDSNGKAVQFSDGPPAIVMSETGPGPHIAVLWETTTPVAYAAMGGDPGADFTPLPRPGAARFLRVVLPGHASSDDADSLDVPLHRTDTLDLLYVASGEADLVLDDSRVHLGTGDYLVMRGDIHGWRNTGTEDCVLVAVMLGAPARD
ncbi:MAG: cupin domain-containing protein [Acidimicrobiales bacterium]|nr:cupin domain-containing protein [Acidimicrobiales bacterium]